MPIYEYRCESCGHQFETLQRISDDPLKECPACENTALRKLISPVAFQLKGQGWYESDFKNAPKKTDKSDKSDQSDSGSATGEGDSSKKTTDGPDAASSEKTGSAASGSSQASEPKGTRSDDSGAS